MDKTRLAIGLVFVAAIGSGIVAGVFFAFSSFVMAALGRISPAQAVAAMNSINVTVINPSFMTAFVGTGVLCLVVGIRSPFLWNHDGAGLVLLASLVYLLGCFGATMVLNVPLNNQLASIADPQRQLRSGRDISRHGSRGTISALLQRPRQPYFLLLHCAEADVIFPNCGSLTQWRCASAARTGLVSTSMSPDHGTPGNGLLSFFRVDDFDLALQRARSLVSRLEEEPHLNSNTRTKEFRSEIRTDITLRSVRSGAKMRTICNADCSRSSHELGATEMDRPGDHWRSPDRAQGVYKHEAKEHDLPLVRQGRA